MTILNLNTLLFKDALEQTISNPISSHCWHRLKDCYQKMDDERLKQLMTNHLQAQTPRSGVAGFLRATWLFSMLNSDSHLIEAGHIIQTIDPRDTDRLTAYLAFVWAIMLKKVNDRAGIIRFANDACLPDVLQILRQSLIQRCTERLVKRKIDKIKKVAIIMPSINGYPHAPTAMALDQARVLIDQEIQVALFTCHDTFIPDMQHFFGAGEKILRDIFNFVDWGSHCLPGITLYQGSEQFSVMRRWIDMLTHIKHFDPDLVMSIGFYSPLIASVYESRPTLALNVHSVAPLDKVDVWLCASAEDAGKTHKQWGEDLSSGIGWHHPYRIKRKQNMSKLSRQDLALSLSSVVLISIGFRLEDEISGAWALNMNQVLKSYPHIIWLLVGGAGKIPVALSQTPTSQVKAMATQTDIAALFQCCDIYVNPPRIGGGFSVAEAMAEGLPVVTYNDSDGGVKVGDVAASSDEEYFAKLVALINDIELRKETGKTMQTIFSNTLDLDKSGPSLLGAYDLALECFMKRS